MSLNDPAGVAEESVLAYIGAMRQFVPAALAPDAVVPLRVRRAPVVYVATK